jgi:hypothetical protein
METLRRTEYTEARSGRMLIWKSVVCIGVYEYIGVGGDDGGWVRECK